MAQGTFTAAGNGAEIRINYRANLSLVFDGTGEVKLQRYMNDDWRDVPNGSWTASTEDIIYTGSMGTPHRLACTAAGSDIHWEVG